MISKIKKIFSKKDKFKLNLILFFNLFTFFTEFLSLASIPVFVALIIDTPAVLDKFEKYNFFYFSNIDYNDVIKIFGIFIIGIFLIKNIINFILIDISSRFAEKIKIDISSKLLKDYLSAPFDYHLKNNPAYLTRNIMGCVEGFSVYITQVINMYKEFLALLVIFILLLAVNPIVTISLTIFFLFLSFLYVKRVRPILKNKSEKNENLKAKLIQMINETFGAIKDIKILNKEKDVIESYNEKRHKLERNILHFTFFQKSPKLILETVSIFLITFSTLFVLNFNNNITTLFTILSLVVIAVVRFIPAFNAIITSMTYIRLYKPSVDIVLNELNKLKVSPFKHAAKHNSFISKNENDFISLENIFFSYPDNDRDILKGISFYIKEGIKLGITGETGAGKSTLFHLMLGLLEPKTGDIYFKNKSIYQNIKDWRNEIGYVAQSIYLLDDTIQKNIAYNFLNEKIDKKRLNFSIEMACLQQKISELPEGINTRVGSDGIKLSGGEKQRVALARAIYKNPSIFFMDEATSALDTETEEKIISNIKSNLSAKTIIMIAHRKSTIQDCDQIINLNNGKLER